ncbi:DUF6427 family protein [Cellulophaga sp. Hel_I_12]|uniref:DUF6427 family protein n=1 Tax=Cellulophaga sp. Hel_I_12 TaxID=1249972 RepID=UPI0006467C49|nr:DUF6427 family protein [Cellulophaga sp. Hel_I_12]
MISSIFGKTKPFNFIIIGAFLFLFYWTTIFMLFSKPYSSENLPSQSMVLVLLCSMVFVINFIVKRNKITETNSYAILFFSLLMVLFPEVLLDNNSIPCTFFLLLATRKLLSIKSLKNIKLKIFDASIWVVVSSLFYDWAILYLLLVFITIYLYQPKKIRNWVIPFIGFFVVGMISLGVLTLFNKPNFIENHYTFSVNIADDFIYQWQSSIKLIIYIVASLLLFVLTFLKLSKSGKGRINTMRLIALFFFIGLVITLLESFNDVTPILLTFFPVSVFLTNYIENIKRSKLKEGVLLFIILIPFVVLITRFK